MTMTTVYTSQTMTPGPMGRLRQLMDNLRSARANQRAARQTFAELSAMNDRDLADIGVSRGDIRNIAAQTVAVS